MTDSKNLSSLECVTILVNQTRLKALSDTCHKLEKLLVETKVEMSELNAEQPEGYKFEY